MRWLVTLAVALAVFPVSALAEGVRTFVPSSWDEAKRIARDQVYRDRKITFYCGCPYTKRGNRGGGRVDYSDCSFKPRKVVARARRIEWEHVVPASVMAGDRACWKTKLPNCSKRGRDCCVTPGVDDEARAMIYDLHNLVPSIGQINGDRSNHPYGFVPGDPRVYGACDFEIGGTPKKVEPRQTIQGNVARIWLYMAESYGIPLSAARRQMFKEWSAADPVGAWETERNRRIKEKQGTGNQFVTP